MSDSCKVLIVGAGPVGLTLACECRRHGLPVRIIDMRPIPSQHSKALAIWASAQEVFASVGVTDRMRTEAFHPSGLRLRIPNRTLIRVPAGRFVDSPYPDVLILPQSLTERILLERFEELGGEVERSVELVGLDHVPGGVEARIKKSEGGEEGLHCDYLVGCDGAHSAVRHAAGIRFSGHSLPECFVLCDARAEGETLPPNDVQITFSPRGPVAMFPLGNGVWRVVASRGSGAGTAPPTMHEMQDHLDCAGYTGMKLTDPLWLSSFRVSERQVDRYRQGRVLLAGDAAHIHSPAGGQGMNTGIQDSFNLGWKLACILLHGGDSSQLLESYSAERFPIARNVISGSSRLTKVATLPPGPLRWVRNLSASLAGRSRKVISQIASTLSGMNLCYPESSPIISADSNWDEDWIQHGFQPGCRIRSCRLHHGDDAYDLFEMIKASTGFTLLIFSGKTPHYSDADRIERLSTIANHHRLPVRMIKVWRGSHTPSDDWLSDPDAEAHRRFGASGPSSYLIRPDHYVAARSQPASPVDLKSALDRTGGYLEPT